MMNQTDSQSDSINEEKPLCLDQQQQHEKINDSVDSHASSSRDYSKGPDLPNMDLLKDGCRDVHLEIGVPLYKASIKGDWEAAKAILNENPELVRFSITVNGEMMNHTDSRSDSINEKKPLCLDQQQQHEKINNSVDSHANSRRDYSKGPNLPNMDLLKGDRKHYLEIGVPLYKASVKGDWEAAKAILNKYPELELVRYSVTENGDTSLHVAASIKSSKKLEKFVENLVKLMTEDDLALENKQYCTAIYLAARCGNIKTVKTMMEKNETLHAILGGGSIVGTVKPPTFPPLYTAALFGNYEVVKYLYEKSNDLCGDDGWISEMRSRFLKRCVDSDMFDIALKVVDKYPELGSNNVFILEALAKKPEAFQEEKSNITERIINIGFSGIGLKAGPLEKEPKALQLLKIILNDFAKRTKSEIDDIMLGREEQINGKKAHPSQILFIAAELGNTKFVVEFISKFPEHIWKVNEDGDTIFHTVVKHRHEGIYNLLYEIGSMKNTVTHIKDKHGNNMLHLAAESTKKKRLEDVSGAALKMQRELLWFKEVESIMPPTYRLKKNKDGLTPRELFTKEHEDLMIQGEQWMKSTASQCMVVATLIATIVFAAAFTVPGGYNQNNGIPMFNRKLTFVVFVVADAISLFLSSTSILTFLSILTSRYAERDFVRSLPMKLMLGLSTLFLSITTMMITFGISFFVLYHNEMKWIPISIGVFAIMPVVLYVVLQYHLLIDVIRATYGGKYLFKPMNQVLFYENPRI